MRKKTGRKYGTTFQEKSHEENLYNRGYLQLNSSIKISLAKMTDVNTVSQIVALAYKDCQEKFKPLPDKIPTWIDWWFSLSKPQPNNHHKFIEIGVTYLILCNDAIIGTFRLEQHDNKSELDDFCILPQHQNKGYGMCVLEMIERLHNTEYIEFATPYFCTVNRYLYRKAGYNEIGTRSDDTVICFSKKIIQNI